MPEMKHGKPEESPVADIFDWGVFLFSSLLFGLFGVLVFKLHPRPDLSLSAFFAHWNRPLLSPEGAERLVYLAGLLYFLLVPAALAGPAARRFPGFGLYLREQWERRPLALMVCASLALAAWVLLISARVVLKFKVIPLYAAGLCAALLVSRGSALKTAFFDELPGVRKYAVLAFSLCFVALASALLAVNDNILLSVPTVKVHFSVLLGTISQVFHGGTVLVDLSSQYGVIYPYLGAMVVKVFGYSLPALVVFFLLLVFLSLSFIAAAVYRKMGVSPGSFVSVLAVTALSHPFFYAAFLNVDPYTMAPYYAYLPIRVLFGAVMLFASKAYLDAPSVKKYWLSAALIGAAVLWNTDTGLVLALSWLALLAFRSFTTERTPWRIIAAIVRHSAAIALSVLAAACMYALYVKGRSGYYPDWGDALRYQAIFYKAGFMMLKMKPLDLWQAPVLIYFFVLFKSVKRLFRAEPAADDNWYFYIAVYGLGIFSYYQGRSHVFCLTAVAYPAALLASFLVYDELRSRLSQGGLRGLDAWRRGAKLALLLFPLCVSLLTVGKSWGALPRALGLRGGPSVGQALAEQVDLVRSRGASRDVLVLSDNAELVYFLAGYRSPFPFASMAEVILQEDLEKVQALLDSGSIQEILVGDGFPQIVGSLNLSKFSVSRRTPAFTHYRFSAAVK